MTKNSKRQGGGQLIPYDSSQLVTDKTLPAGTLSSIQNIVISKVKNLDPSDMELWRQATRASDLYRERALSACRIEGYKGPDRGLNISVEPFRTLSATLSELNSRASFHLTNMFVLYSLGIFPETGDAVPGGSHLDHHSPGYPKSFCMPNSLVPVLLDTVATKLEQDIFVKHGIRDSSCWTVDSWKGVVDDYELAVYKTSVALCEFSDLTKQVRSRPPVARGTWNTNMDCYTIHLGPVTLSVDTLHHVESVDH